MIAFVRLPGDRDQKDRETYHCSRCGTFITDSGAVLSLNGSERHSFVNPAGVLCKFTTFGHCDNVVQHQELFVEHSWFIGYGWRFLVCAVCYQHLGWKYDAVRRDLRPRAFFGLLNEAVEAVGPVV